VNKIASFKHSKFTSTAVSNTSLQNKSTMVQLTASIT